MTTNLYTNKNCPEIYTLQRADTAFRLRQCVQKDVFAAHTASIVVADALALLNKPVIRRVFERQRPVMLPTSRSLLNRLSTLFVAALLTANPVFRQRAVQEMRAVTDFSDWNPDHFLDTAEMAAGVALGRVWFAADMLPSERATVDDALHHMVICPGKDQFEQAAFWISADHNWNVVCSAGLILACIAAETAPSKERGELLDLATSAIQTGFQGFGADGGYREGPSYWELALRYSILATLFQPSLKLPEGALKSWRFNKALISPSGTSVNYGDSTLYPRRSPFLGWLALQSEEKEAADWQRSAPGRPHPFDLIWLAPKPEDEPCERPSVEHFEDICTVLRSSSSDLPDAFLFLKSGSNADNHAHLDLGTFVFEAGGASFLCDLGREAYSHEGYFGEERFSFFRATTRAHNTITIGNQDQSPAARARLVFHSQSDAVSCVVIDVEDHRSGFSHRRGVVLTKDALWVRDEWAPEEELTRSSGSKDDPLVWRAYTDAEVSHGVGGLKLHKGSLSLTCNVMVPAAGAITTEAVEDITHPATGRAVTCLRATPDTISDTGCLVVCFGNRTNHGEDAPLAMRQMSEWPAWMDKQRRRLERQVIDEEGEGP